MSRELEILKINYKDWLKSAYNYYITYEDSLFDDYTWDLMYYQYMTHIEDFPFLKEVGMDSSGSLFYVSRVKFEAELTRLGFDF